MSYGGVGLAWAGVSPQYSMPFPDPYVLCLESAVKGSTDPASSQEINTPSEARLIISLALCRPENAYHGMALPSCTNQYEFNDTE